MSGLTACLPQDPVADQWPLFSRARSLVGNPAAGALLIVGHGSYTGLILMSGISIMVGSGFMLLSKLRIDPDLFARV